MVGIALDIEQGVIINTVVIISISISSVEHDVQFGSICIMPILCALCLHYASSIQVNIRVRSRGSALICYARYASG